MMRVIASTDLSTIHRGKRVNRSVTLQEQFGVYIVVLVEYTAGFFGGRYHTEILDTCFGYGEAARRYEKYIDRVREDCI